MLYVIGPKYPTPEGAVVINTTSRSENWSRGLSPFFAGPVDLYDGYKSVNVENAWQYSKVYYNHVDANDIPTKEYFEWANKGWNSIKAHRYPMGKGAIPLFSYWDGQKLSYTEARHKIYIPLYAQAVQKTFAFQKLKKMYAENKDLYLWDFDGYNHKTLGLTYEQVINDPNRKMGHAFVIAMLLEGYLNV
jgi:hypothetical protein